MATSRTNWAGNVTFSARRFLSPTSVPELQELVARSNKVRALGSGHSFNRLADSAGDLVSVLALPRRIEVDSTKSTALVGAGTRYGELAVRLQAAGFALENLGSLPQISIAGAVATGTHGSGNTVGGLAAAVVSLERVGADGELVEIGANSDPDFNGSVVALGALGVVTTLTLRVVPAFEMQQWVYDDMPAAAAREHAEEIFASAYSVSMFTDWRSDSFRQVWLKQRVGTGTDEAAPPRQWLGATLADGQRHPIAGKPVENCTEQLGANGPWHARLPHFRSDFTPSSGHELQSEYLVPREHTIDVLTALRGIHEQLAPAVQICEIRTIARDDLWLSPSYARDSLAIHFTWLPDPVAVARALDVLEAALAPFEPRPHWAKLFNLRPQTIASRYERYDDFAALMTRIDPRGKFRNDLLDLWFPHPVSAAVPPPTHARRQTSR